MRSLSSIVIIGIFPCILIASDPWPQILSSIGDQPGGGNRIVVAGPGSTADPSWKKRVGSGTILILEGESPLAASFGFRPSGSPIEVTALVDVHMPKAPLVLEKPVTVYRFRLPDGATIFTKDRWSGAPLVAGIRVASGAVLWVAASPGKHGYERFPYLPQALVSLGWEPAFRANRTWAFFDYAYRSRVDLDYFATRWKRAGISALHVAAWHFYDRDAERERYLRRLIEACHREGILVYAWLELPHVSEKFWADHPRWREKTAVLQDAALDWRKLMNLENPDCSREVKAGVADLIGRFNWDGVNLAELYYESLEGMDNPSRFTPMNDDVRGRFRAENGFDPADLWSSRTDEKSRRQFLNFRTALASHMQTEWLAEMEKARLSHRDLDIVLTHVDDRMDRGMTDAIGADSGRAFSLLKDHSFTFLVEDPATLWNLGPLRYPAIAKQYPASEKLAIDINVVDRYQDVYPTKQQTGIELFELVHLAAESFPRVALYFENSILAPDLSLLSAASAVVTRFERTNDGLTVDSPHGFTTPWEGSALVDDAPWAALDGKQINLPAGKHSVRRAADTQAARLVGFNGELISASSSGKRMAISYSSSGRALATIDCEPDSVAVDGSAGEMSKAGKTLLLPAGRRQAVVVCR